MRWQIKGSMRKKYQRPRKKIIEELAVDHPNFWDSQRDKIFNITVLVLFVWLLSCFFFSIEPLNQQNSKDIIIHMKSRFKA